MKYQNLSLMNGPLSWPLMSRYCRKFSAPAALAAAGFEVGVELAVLRVASALDHRGHRGAGDGNVCGVSRCRNLGLSKRAVVDVGADAVGARR